jgi:hypothetical protein
MTPARLTGDWLDWTRATSTYSQLPADFAVKNRELSQHSYPAPSPTNIRVLALTKALPGRLVLGNPECKAQTMDPPISAAASTPAESAVQSVRSPSVNTQHRSHSPEDVRSSPAIQPPAPRRSPSAAPEQNPRGAVQAPTSIRSPSHFPPPAPNPRSEVCLSPSNCGPTYSAAIVRIHIHTLRTPAALPARTHPASSAQTRAGRGRHVSSSFD